MVKFNCDLRRTIDWLFYSLLFAALCGIELCVFTMGASYGVKSLRETHAVVLLEHCKVFPETSTDGIVKMERIVCSTTYVVK